MSSKNNNSGLSSENTLQSFELGRTTGIIQKELEVQKTEIQILKKRVKRLEIFLGISVFVICVGLVAKYHITLKELFMTLLRLS